MEIINSISELVALIAMGAGLVLLAMLFSVLMARVAGNLFDG